MQPNTDSADTLWNSGTVSVTSGDTLRLRRDLASSGTLTVSATGRILVDGVFTRTGAAVLTSGATVKVKYFASVAAHGGWAASEEPDATGYYTLIPTEAPPSQRTYTVTFHANQGVFADGSETKAVQTNTDTRVTLPEEPTRGTAYEFLGWFDASEGGNQVLPTDSLPNADQTFCAQWKIEGFHWEIDESGTKLCVFGTGPMPDYTFSASVPWYDQKEQLMEIVVEEGITSIGDFAFRSTGARSIKIAGSVTDIGGTAFFGNINLTEITLPKNGFPPLERKPLAAARP